MYNIVTNSKIMMDFKKSPHFRTNLGLVNTVEKNGYRTYNENSGFSYFYNDRYKTTVHGQGNIGSLMFYVDHYIIDPLIALYNDDNDEYIYTFDQKLLNDKGIDFYIGHLIKVSELQKAERINEAIQKDRDADNRKKNADPNKLLVNPGQVTYDDLKAYIEKKRNRDL